MFVLIPSARLLAFTLLLACALTACDSSETSLYDPTVTGNEAPVVESVTPSGVVLAGIDVVTITGRNFSETPGNNIVTFDDGAGASGRATVIEASPTTLRVRVPNLPSAALRLRVAVIGAPDFSTPMPFPLVSATVPFSTLDSGTEESLAGIASDNSGVLYGSLGIGSAAAGIFTFLADAPRQLYFASTTPWADLAVAPDGQLYGVRRLRALFRLPQGGAQQTFVALPNGVTLAAVAAAPNGDLWTGGSNTTAANGALYRVTSDGTSTAFPFSETVRDLAVADGALYVASTGDAGSRVWRYVFNADGTLGAGAVYTDVSAALGAAVSLNAIAVAQDGTLFIGTNASDPVLEVAPGGTSSAPLFPGVLTPPVSAFAWATGSKLYVTQERIGATPSSPAIAARLYTLETRRPGPH